MNRYLLQLKEKEELYLNIEYWHDGEPEYFLDNKQAAHILKEDELNYIKESDEIICLVENTKKIKNCSLKDFNIINYTI